MPLSPISTTDAQQAVPGVRVSGVLAGGGQKIVFDAVDPDHGRVALKFIRPGTTTAVHRTIRELQTATQLDGPQFARILRHGETSVGGEPAIYVVEEFLDGGSLRDRLNQVSALSIRQVLDLAEDLLSALVQVERARLVHRDIKPENIMLAPRRTVLIDFGIARHLDLPSLTFDGQPSGPMTPGYAAPEQIKNQKRAISIRTDLFALGVVLYECTAGFNPFVRGATTREEVLQRTLSFTPSSLAAMVEGVPPQFAALVTRCLEKAPHRRPVSAAELRQELQEIRD